MKTVTLSDNDTTTIQNILLLPNYILDHIHIKAGYDLFVEGHDLYSTILLLVEKINIGGLLSIEIIDVKLICQNYLSSTIDEQEFTKLICQNRHKKIDIPYFRSLIKSKNDIRIKNISADVFLNTIVIEREKIL